ncbi:MAG: nucleoid occlusion factor SlmA [Pseudomonadaceae bacterium]|nr:nucleoid occlusion factor SlmA [Pseudomonadaceae bacterium]
MAGQRKQQILQALASMLQADSGGKITTAALAREVGVSEAALYRHFPSKAKMLEALIEYMEESIFPRCHDIARQNEPASVRCGRIALLLLIFAERNPGFARILVGDVLLGETERLRVRMRQFFDRLETELRQVVREEQARSPTRPVLAHNAVANLVMAMTEGRINQFVRGQFRDAPSAMWEEQWRAVSTALFAGTSAD